MNITSFDEAIIYLSSLDPTLIYFSIIGVLLLCGFGLPIPEDILLIASGYLAYKGLVNVHLMMIVAFLGVVIGDCSVYFIGVKFGNKLLRSRVFSKILNENKLEKARAYLHKYGNCIFFVGRFLPGLRSAIFIIGGSLHVQFKFFIKYDGSAALISVPLWIYSAWHFGNYIELIIKIFHKSERYILSYVGLLVFFHLLTYLIKRKLRKKREVKL